MGKRCYNIARYYDALKNERHRISEIRTMAGE